MSVFVCARCDGYRDSDDGCEECGRHGLLCTDCLDELSDDVVEKIEATPQGPNHSLNVHPLVSRQRRTLARALRRGAEHIEQNPILGVQDAKDTLLAALNDLDRELNYGNAGRGIDELLGKKENVHV